MSSYVIAIDGPAGSGKSSTSSAVSQALGFGHLDSGGLYRAATLVALEEGLPIDGAGLMAALARREVALEWRDGRFQPTVEGQSVEKEVRGPDVTAAVSKVAALAEVRAWVNERLRSSARTHPVGVVIDGRDIGTAVFPDASVKFFLSADPLERARRRAKELGIDSADEIAALAREIGERDQADMNRTHDPLRQASDAIEIDTTDLTFDAQVARILDLAGRVFDLTGPEET